jgi:hypothetical protein
MGHKARRYVFIFRFIVIGECSGCRCTATVALNLATTLNVTLLFTYPTEQGLSARHPNGLTARGLGLLSRKKRGTCRLPDAI